MAAPGQETEAPKIENSAENMNKQTLRAVLQFLKKNNLNETEALLKKEAQFAEEEEQQQSEQPSSSQVTQALAVYKSEGDPRGYVELYTQLKNFVDSSLDVHKCELAMVLYPVFVHMYLELVYNDHEQSAKDFFEKFSSDQEVYYQDDLRQLATVSKPEHMKGNQLMENFKSSQFTIRMSRDSYNHLKRHLLDKKHNMLLTIVQDRLFIDVFDGAPRTKAQINASFGGMIGEAKREANKPKVFYGLLKEPDLNIPLDDEDDNPEESGDKPKRKKPKKDPQLTKKAKNDPNAPSNTRIPLPEIKDADKLEKIRCYKEMMKKVLPSATNVPSVCFYTLLNSQYGVTSVDISEDSSLMAVGFANSQIRIWTISPSKLRGMKPLNDLNIIDKEADDVLERIMDDRTSTECKTLHGHSGPVYATSFTMDKTLMVSCSEDGTIRLWSLLTWTNLVCFKGHVYPVWDVKFSPHGHYFASCSHDRTARLWATNMYTPLRIFAGHLSDVDCIQFHPNSNYIVTGSTDRTVRLWDVLNGNCVRVMTGHKGVVYCLAFSCEGRYLASGGEDKMVLIWDVSNGDMVAQLQGHTNTIYTLAYCRGATVLASGGLDNTVRIWDTQKLLEDIPDADGIIGTQSDAPSYEIVSLRTKNSPVQCVHFTRKNLLLATGPYVT